MEVLLTNGLPYIQVTLAIVLIVAILLQQRGAGLGGALGGGDEGTIHYERRGSERTMFRATVVVAILFVVASATPLFLANPVQTNETTPAPVGIQVKTDEGETQTVPAEDITTDTTAVPNDNTATPQFPLGQ
jgi:preprotein translocase subunit SecG